MTLGAVVAIALLASFGSAPTAQADTLNYPWYNATTLNQSTYDWGYATCPTSDPGCKSYSNLLYTLNGVTYGEADPWGYYLRNCTSYTAWRLTSVGVSGSSVSGLGDGGQWYDNAPANERSSTPAAWDAAVSPSQDHVAFVESVNSDGTITVSEYNYNGTGVGRINTGTPSALGFTEFVNFGIHPSSGSGTTRIAVVDTSGDAYIKDGGLNASYTKIWDHTMSTAAADIQLSPNRIAIRDTSGNLWVNQYPITNTWVEEATGISTGNYQIADGNIAVLDSGGTLSIKQGTGYSSLSNSWNTDATSVINFRMAQNGNIAVTVTNGTVWAAWGGYGNSWVELTGGYIPYDISNNDLAIVNGGELYVMVGAPGNNSWNPAMSSAAGVQLAAGGNLAGVDTSGYLNVAWGGYGSQWTAQVANNYTSYQLTDSQVGVLFDNTLYVKEGTASGGWTIVADNAVSFALS